MSDVRVQIRFRNDLLQRLIDEQPLPLYKLAKEIGVGYGVILYLKSLRHSPYSNRNREEFSETAKKIAAYFNITPEVLFPEDIYRIKWPSKLEKAFPAERVACLVQSDDQRLRALLPHEFVENEETKVTIKNVLKSLTPRERRVIEMKFGLGEEEKHTLEEIGQDFEVTRERVRQIEARALRKMGHPAKHLRGIL